MASSGKNVVTTAGPANRVFKPTQTVVVSATVLASGAATESTLSTIATNVDPNVSASANANVSSSTSSVQLFASNSSAVERSIFNDSTATLYVKYGTSASATSFKVKMGPGDYFEFPRPIYTGIVHGIWDAVNGAARVEEG